MSRYRSQGFSGFFLLAILSLLFAACSVPNLESPQCTAGRETVKRFYSFHFGTEMRADAESVKARERFLTADLIKGLAGSQETKKDYFTATENYPRAFRVGECRSDSGSKVTLQVVLLWRNDDKSEQKEVNVEAVDIDGKWLINKVF